MGPSKPMKPLSGGKEANKHKGKKLHTRGTVGKAAVVGMKDRETNQITAMPVKSVDRSTLQGFVHRHTLADTIVYTDEAAAYVGWGGPRGAPPSALSCPASGAVVAWVLLPALPADGYPFLLHRLSGSSDRGIASGAKAVAGTTAAQRTSVVIVAPGGCTVF